MTVPMSTRDTPNIVSIATCSQWSSMQAMTIVVPKNFNFVRIM